MLKNDRSKEPALLTEDVGVPRAEAVEQRRRALDVLYRRVTSPRGRLRLSVI
jgi:hypothetical protein